MKFHRIFVIIVLLLAGFYLAGCCGGSSKEKVIVEKQVPSQEAAPPTLGKQLDDLKEAYKKGSITKEEYEIGKKKLLEQQQ